VRGGPVSQRLTDSELRIRERKRHLGRLPVSRKVSGVRHCDDAREGAIRTFASGPSVKRHRKSWLSRVADCSGTVRATPVSGEPPARSVPGPDSLGIRSIGCDIFCRLSLRAVYPSGARTTRDLAPGLSPDRESSVRWACRVGRRGPNRQTRLVHILPHSDSEPSPLIHSLRKIDPGGDQLRNLAEGTIVREFQE